MLKGAMAEIILMLERKELQVQIPLETLVKVASMAQKVASQVLD
jgi:hypothetical protein